MPSYKQSADRIRAFRAAHRVGQRISGRLLRWQGRSHGLVNIQGHELTALISSSPEPGQVLHFVVERLHPDIVLRELHDGPDGKPSVAVLLADFRAARTEADEALKAVQAPPVTDDLMERKRTYHRRAARDPETLLPLTRLTAAVSALNEILPPLHDARLSCPKWLLPGASSLELVEFGPERGGAMETRLFFYFSSLGRCELRLLHKSGAGRLRIFTEDTTASRAASNLLASASPIFGRFDFLGASPLPPESKAGVLARLLNVDLAGPFSFDRRV